MLLDIAIDFCDGTLSPEACGFTEADIQEAIDVHHHHSRPAPGLLTAPATGQSVVIDLSDHDG